MIERKEGKVESLLQRGAEHALSTRALMGLCGFSSVRELRKAVETERRAGALILSKRENGGGYFLPADGEKGRAETASFLRVVDASVRHYEIAAAPARAFLRNCEGQQRLEVVC